MIKAILFDLDGVLIEAKHLHYLALNEALETYGFKITRLEHWKKYDGHTTKDKLQMLTEEKGLPERLHEPIWKLKQNLTDVLINRTIHEDKHITTMLQRLKDDGYIIGVCTNSIRSTCEKILRSAKIYEYFDIVLSNQDVIHPKPSPEIYLTAIQRLRLSPEEVIIVEDSPIGLHAAYDSGANVCPVKNTKDCSYDKVKRKIIEVEL